MYRFSRSFNADNLPSFALPPQLVDPSLRGGDALFPNLRVGKFGREALAEDLTPYRVAKMFRPDVINMNASNPRLAKASNDIQFQKAGQSPGQAKALGELIRKDPVLGNSFNVGYGSTLNREQGLAQKQGRVYEFDPTDEMWKSGFKRRNPDIVAMDDLQDALRTLPSGSQLTTYDGRPLDPSFTKTYYSFDTTQDINDPQLFYNLKRKSDVDYGRIAQALDSVPKDANKKTDYSLAKRWERVQGYSPRPPRGATYVLNADKPYQSIDEIMAEVNQVEPWRTPRMADSRIARSQNSGNSDLNIIPKDYTRKEYLEATGDSDNLPPLDYSPNNTLVELFGGIAADRDGNTFPLTRLKRKESSVIGREFDESNAKSAFTFPIETKRAYKLLKDGNPVIEDRTFLLNSPDVQLPIRASASILPQNYYGAKRNIPTGVEGIIRGFDIKKNPYPSVDLPVGYYGIERDIPTALSAIEEGLTGRKGSVVGYADARIAQRPTTRLEREELGTDYYNPYRESYGKGETTLSDNLYLKNFSEDPNNIYSTALAWDESNPNIANYPRRISEYYRLPSQTYSVGRRDNLPMYVTKDGEERYFKTFTSPEVVLPKELTYRGRSELGMMPSSYSPKQSPNQYRIAGSTAPQGGYREFNEVMDEGIQASRDLDFLYKENDELADLANLPFFAPQGEAIAYQQSEILDKIVDAERITENMGGTYRRLSGKNDQGSFEEERMAYEGRPSAITQYNVNEVLEPSFGSDYSGRTNTGRIRTSVGTEYDAGIPVSATVKTRLANQAIDPIQLDNPTVELFNVAQYNRDLLKRGSILIDTQLGIPIVKAPTASFNPATQRNESYLQPVRPSRIANGVANWQAPESLAIGRVGRQVPVENIPDPRNTRIEDDLSSYIKWLSNNQLVKQNPLTINTPNTYTRTAQPSIGQQLGVEPRIAQPFNPQTIYPNTGVGPINTGLKPKPFLSELFGFSAITPEGLAKYRDMG